MSRSSGKPTTTKPRRGGGSARPSEERSTPLQVAGKKRVRDADTERVSSNFPCVIVFAFPWQRPIFLLFYLLLSSLRVSKRQEIPKMPHKYLQGTSRNRGLPYQLGHSSPNDTDNDGSSTFAFSAVVRSAPSSWATSTKPSRNKTASIVTPLRASKKRVRDADTECVRFYQPCLTHSTYLISSQAINRN